MYIQLFRWLSIIIEQISKTLVDCGNYDELYTTSIKDPDFFWGTLAKQFLQWDKPFEKVEDCSMEEGEIKWFTGGKLNVSGIYNCIMQNTLQLMMHKRTLEQGHYNNNYLSLLSIGLQVHIPIQYYYY